MGLIIHFHQAFIIWLSSFSRECKALYFSYWPMARITASGSLSTTFNMTLAGLATKDQDLRFAQDAARGTDRVIELGTLHAATSRRVKFRYTLVRSSALSTPANGVTFRKSRPWRLGSRTAATISSIGRDKMLRH